VTPLEERYGTTISTDNCHIILIHEILLAIKIKEIPLEFSILYSAIKTKYENN
jgi:hypothetical protein